MDDTTAATADPARRPTRAVEPRGTTLATLGFLMAAAGPLLLIVASLIFGLDTEDIALLRHPGRCCGLLGAYLVRRRSTVAKAIAIVLAVIIAVHGVLDGRSASALPASFFDFVPGILVLPGVLLAIGATITAIRLGQARACARPGRAARRGRDPRRAGRARRRCPSCSP